MARARDHWRRFVSVLHTRPGDGLHGGQEMSKGFPKYYPNVAAIRNISDALQGEFNGGRPRGLTIHYTASMDLDTTIKHLISNNLKYHLIIDRFGSVFQLAPFTHKVWHAGRAKWHENSPNQSHVSIAILNWGILGIDGKTWSGHKLLADQIAFRNNAEWHKATELQERSLKQVCRWFVAMGIDPEQICGHSECCIPAGRKVDPGGSLSFTIHDLRKILVNVVA